MGFAGLLMGLYVVFVGGGDGEFVRREGLHG